MFKPFKQRKTEKVKAVQDADLSSYLKSLGVLDAVLNGKHKCKFCGTTITIDNLEAIVPHENQIYFVCSNARCMNQI